MSTAKICSQIKNWRYLLMGSSINLKINHLELDCLNNGNFNNHSVLFQKDDKRTIDYIYADNIVEKKEGYSKKGYEVKDRLDLLGYTLSNLKLKYNNFLTEISTYTDVNLPFDVFYDAVYKMNINKTIDCKKDDDYFLLYLGDLGTYLWYEIFKQKGLHPLDIEKFQFVDPYIVLRIILNNPKNYDSNINWYYMDYLDAGYYDNDKTFAPNLPFESKIFIVTEGSTDTLILKKTIRLLFPHISDFFEFIDMKGDFKFPLTGAPNLLSFYKALLKLKIQNKTIFIFDNDKEGVDATSEIKKLSPLHNLLALNLPNLKEANTFPVTTNGLTNLENINSKFVTIENFLDFETNDVKILDGKIYPKKKLQDNFKQHANNFTNYDFDKLKFLIEYIIKKWNTYYVER